MENISKEIGKINQSIRDKIDILRKNNERELNIWENNNKERNVEKIIIIGEEYLKNTRDLIIGIRLAESYTILKGLEGLIKGINLLENLWINSYPTKEEEKQEIKEWIINNLSKNLYSNHHISTYIEEGLNEEVFLEIKAKCEITMKLIDNSKYFFSNTFKKNLSSILDNIEKRITNSENNENLQKHFKKIKEIAEEILEKNPTNEKIKEILKILG